MISSPSASLGISSSDLFLRYQKKPDGESYRCLVDRHLPLVWSTARRIVNGDTALAEDVTQIVFTDFARKAPALPPETIAAGWLHRLTCFTARKLVRTEIRRRTRENTAALLQLDDAMTPEPTSLWLDAAPLVDAALDQLPRPDREALLLRFWQQQDHRSIGIALGSTEDAARKRIARALEKLRTLLRRRGVLLTAALLSQCLTDHATAAVPSTLAATLPGAAWRQATASGPIMAVAPSPLRRFWPAAAAAVVLTGGLWTAASAGWFSASAPITSTIFSTAQPLKPVPSTDITLHFTMADIPAGTMARRLLTYEHSGDDTTLFTEVHHLASTSGKLAEFSLTGQSGKTMNFEKIRTYPYSDRWTWDEKLQRPIAGLNEIRKLGMTVEVIPNRIMESLVTVEWAVSYDYAEPVFHAWPISLREPEGEPGPSVNMEDFHNCQLRGYMAGLTNNTPRLLGSEFLNAAALPEAQPEPRVLMVFVTLADP